MSGSELWCFRVIFMAMHGMISCEVQSVLVLCLHEVVQCAECWQKRHIHYMFKSELTFGYCAFRNVSLLLNFLQSLYSVQDL